MAINPWPVNITRTIFDFGCLGSPLTHVLPALTGAIACVILTLGLAALGRYLTRNDRLHGDDILYGWGIVAVLMTIAAVSFLHALVFTAYGIFALMFCAAMPGIRRGYFISPFLLLAIFPGLVVMTALNASGIAIWDDFSHWTLNALYLFQNNGVPSQDMPPPHSIWPGYPYALPFLTYLASQIAGGFLMQGGAMINFMLLLSFASILAEVGRPAKSKFSMGLTSLALLAVTLMNPSFNASITMTSQGDTSTMILVGVLGLLFWDMIDALTHKKSAEVNQLALKISLIAVTLVLIKQVNIVLLGLSIFGFLLVAWKNKILNVAIKWLPMILFPALVLRFLWQHHVNTQMAVGSVNIRPLHDWRFDLLDPFLNAMIHAMLKMNGQYGLMLVIMAFGIVSLFRPPTRLRNYTVLAATVYGGYLAFLIVAYMGASNFSENEIRRAGSFYRYGTHAGLLGIIFVWLAAPLIWKWFKTKFVERRFTVLPIFQTGTVAGSLLILPLVIVFHINWLAPQPSAEVCESRATGRWISSTLPDHSHLGIIAPSGDSFPSYILNFELGMEEIRSGHTSTATKQVDNPSVDAIFIQKTENAPNKIRGFDIRKGHVLLERKGNNWVRIHLPPL